MGYFKLSTVYCLVKASGVTPIGQGWTNAKGLRGLGGPSLTLKFN